MNAIRHGFALNELIVLIALVTLTMGIATPAIVVSRDAARQNRCAANLREIGAGAHGFAESNDQMLPFNQLAAPFGSWNTQLLPHIGREKLARDYNPGHDWWASKNSPNRAVVSARVETFLCPAAPHPDRQVLTMDPETEGQSFLAGATDYVGSAGAYYQDNQQHNLHPGAMHHRTLVKRLRIPDIVDGTSQTLLVVEMADKPNSWQAGRLADDRTDKPQSTSLSGQWAAPNWNHLRSHTADGTSAFGPCAVNCSNGAAIYGFHSGGANVLFVDGSVRFLKAGMSQELLIALVSYAGGELIASADD
ncbi:DUF1559 family PulG-like putative transporter [Schlesneria paludicola]|uniref:DUF1559 family PulG-like putative transporter n=1 Tax=Schlesneria paludicola TaxID=360056 RepID=UPI000299E49E|nr:DUF1559 domain-containing protein [Schlesneria paludicola]